MALLVFGAGERVAHAFNCTWTSNSGTWGQAFRWSNCNGTTPQSTDTVTVSGGSLAAITTTIAGLTVSGGTLSVGNVALTVNGGFSQTNGTFSMTAGTMSVSGSFSRSMGTFTASGGTITLAGTGMNLSNTSSFAGLTVTGTYTLMSTLTTSGTLTVSSGSLSVGSNALNLGALTVNGGTLTITSAATTVNGTVTLSSGTYTASSGTTNVSGSFLRSGTGTFAGNGGTVNFTGTGTVTSAGGSFAVVTIASTANITLGDALTTSGNLTTAGTFSAGTYAVSVGGNFSQTNGTFTAPSGTMTVTGSFSHTTGTTFTANGGTLNLNSLATVSHTFGGASLNKVVLGVDSGLVGYWRLDEPSGAAIYDSSGYGNNGNLVNGFGRTSSLPSMAFSDTAGATFDGTAYSTMGVTGMPANNQAQSISLWVNLTSNAGVQNFCTLINLGTGSAVQVGIRNPDLVVWSYGGGTLASGTLPTTGAWHHILYSYDGLTHRVYLDGVAQTSTTNAAQTSTPTQTYLGSYDGANEFLYGALDDVRVYNRALSAAEVTTLRGGNNLAGVGGNHTFTDTFTSTGDLLIAGGTLTGTSPLTIGGSWNNQGGTFTGTGAVTLTATDAGNVVVSNGSQFYSLTVNGNGGTYTVADALIDRGTLTIGTGATVAGTGTIAVGGNWANAGTFTGSGTVTLNGTSGGTITSNGSRFAGLTIAAGSSSYTLTDRLWVPGGTVTLTSGTLAASTFPARVGGFSVGSGSFTYSSTGTLIIDGASNQTLALSSYAGALRLEDPTETNLTAYWKLDAGAGSQVYDHTGNGNNGTLSTAGTTWQTSVGTTFGFDNPASVSFNGTSGTATIPSATLPALNGAQTVSFWMNPTTMGGTQNMMAFTGAGGGNQLGIRGGTLYVWSYGGATLIVGPAVTTNAWHHVVYTYDGAGNQSLTVDGVRTTATATNQGGATTYAYLATYSPNNELYSGALDEVRVYNTVLTTAQIAQLYAGRYAGTGGIATYTLGANTTVTGQLFVDDVILDSSTRTMNAGYATSAAQINSGTYLVGSNTQTFAGGLTVSGGGTLSLPSSGGAVAIANTKTLTVDGTLSASSSGATIQVSSSGTYAFKVGSTSTARPTINVTGLAVKNTDANGMWINTVSGSSTTFTHFDGIAFNNGATSTPSQYLQVSQSSLYLTANALSFGAGETGTLPTYAVKLTGNGTGDGFETRLILAGATCASAKTDSTTTLCQTSWKSDDDAPDSDGTGNTLATNGAVVQFIRLAPNDTAGTIEGFPVAAFDWNTFAYYSTYVTFHDVSGTVDRVYVRDATGAAKYSWSSASGENIVGTPRYVTSGSAHYIYVATNGSTTDSGQIYRLLDNGSSLTPDTSGNWSGRNPFTCSCTITTPLGLDATNLYWGGTTGGGQRVFRLAQALAASTPFGLSNVTIGQTVTSVAPAQLTIGTTVYMFLGMTGHVLKVDVTNMMAGFDNNSPGTATVFGRIGSTTTPTARVFVGDDGGKMRALDAGTNFTSAALWTYNGTDAIKSSSFYDSSNQVLMFGTESGKLVALNSSGSVLSASYPLTPDSSTGPIRSAILYTQGLVAVGTTTGKLYFVDRSGATLVRKYDFGSSESVSGIGYDSIVNRYIVTTSDATTKDGRIYYIDRIADPTAAAP